MTALGDAFLLRFCQPADHHLAARTLSFSSSRHLRPTLTSSLILLLLLRLCNFSPPLPTSLQSSPPAVQERADRGREKEFRKAGVRPQSVILSCLVRREFPPCTVRNLFCFRASKVWAGFLTLMILCMVWYDVLPVT